MGSRYWSGGIALIVLAIASYYLWFFAQAGFSVDRNTVVIDKVKRGEFIISVRGTGVLVPDNIQWLSGNVEGRVERVTVKPGKVVKKGELIAELSNPQLLQFLEETRWELEANIAENKAENVAQKSAMLAQRAIVENAKLNFESSKLEQEAHAQLFQKSTGAISKIDYERTILETAQFQQRWKIQQEIFSTMEENMAAQREARGSRLQKMRKILERAQQQVNSLQIFASIDSVVQEVAVEPGQRLAMGSNIAKLAEQNSLIVELQVPELQIRGVKIGQRVVIDTRNNKVSGLVTRVDPAVINGNVQVDVEFSEEIPTDARPDLTVEGEIKIAEVKNTLYVDRPLFSQSQSQTALYRMSEDGNFAEKIFVTLGQGSLSQIQILEGLAAGEKIIISDPSQWDSYQKIRIN